MTNNVLNTNSQNNFSDWVILGEDGNNGNSIANNVIDHNNNANNNRNINNNQNNAEDELVASSKKLAEALDNYAKVNSKPRKFSFKTKFVVGLFTLGIGAAVLHSIEKTDKKNSEEARLDTFKLRTMLKNWCKLDDLSGSLRYKFNDNTILKISKDAQGCLDVTLNDDKIECNNKLERIIEIIDLDIIKNSKYYGNSNALKVINQQESAIRDLKRSNNPDKNNLIRLSQEALDKMNKIVLCDKLGLEEADIENVASKTKSMRSMQYLEGQVSDKEKVKESFLNLTNTKINSEDMLEILAEFEKIDEKEVSTKVIIQNNAPKNFTHKNQEEFNVHKFVSDLIFPEDTLDADKKDVVDILLTTLVNNDNTLSKIIKNPKLLDSLEPSMKEFMTNLIDSIKVKFKINSDHSEDDITKVIKNTIDNVNGDLNLFMEKIDKDISEFTSVVAENMAQKMVNMFNSMCEYQKGKLVNVDPNSLEYKMKMNAADIKSPGMAMFMHKVLDQYFTTMPKNDRRSMIASLVRYSNNDANDGAKLGAMLKGAGPLLQKMMQAYEGSDLPEEFRAVLNDMKSNLAPIPNSVVKASLYNMVEKSNGKISKIDVIKSLGAATIGQTFLCNLTLSDGTKKKCAIKLLRSDIQNRMKLEEDLFNTVSSTVPGMKSPYLARIESIKKEMDFEEEAKNIIAGGVYNNTHLDKIGSVGVSKDIPPQKNALVLDYVKGDTLDAFESEFKMRLDSILGKFKVVDPNTQKVTYRRPETLTEFGLIKKELNELFEEALPYQKMMVNASELWFTEVLYKTGVFHGDLHPGNIMVNKDHLTFIDFGNASKLSKDQQSSVLSLCAAATAGNVSIFLKHINKLLDLSNTDDKIAIERQEIENSKAKLEEDQNGSKEIYNQLKAILRSGDSKTETGRRMMAAISELQRFGITVPDELFKFTEALVRLQSGLETMNSFIKEIQNGMVGLNSTLVNNQEGKVPQKYPLFKTVDDIYKNAHSLDELSSELNNFFFDQSFTKDNLKTMLTENYDQVKELVDKEPLAHENFVLEFNEISKYFDPSLALRINLPAEKINSLYVISNHLTGEYTEQLIPTVLNLDSEHSSDEDIKNAYNNATEQQKKDVDFLREMAKYQVDIYSNTVTYQGDNSKVINMNRSEFAESTFANNIFTQNFAEIKDIIKRVDEKNIKPNFMRLCFNGLKEYFGPVESGLEKKPIPAENLKDPKYLEFNSFFNGLHSGLNLNYGPNATKQPIISQNALGKGLEKYEVNDMFGILSSLIRKHVDETKDKIGFFDSVRLGADIINIMA